MLYLAFLALTVLLFVALFQFSLTKEQDMIIGLICVIIPWAYLCQQVLLHTLSFFE